MNGEKTPCIPSLVPVVQLAQPGKLFGRIVERSGALEPSRISRDNTGKRPASESGLMMSKVAPSNPMMTVFIQRNNDTVKLPAFNPILDAPQRALNIERPSMLSELLIPIAASSVGATSVM
jgi:hypothetical protein